MDGDDASRLVEMLEISESQVLLFYMFASEVGS